VSTDTGRPVVRTVLGDLPSAALGATDYHEHLFQVSPLLPGDELDDERASGAEARSLVDAGIGAIIEATPTGLGRDPAAVARISAATGLHVVHVSGGHRQEHYPPGHWLLSADEETLRRRFVADVQDGLPATDPATESVADLTTGSAGDPAGGGLTALGPSGLPVRAGMLKAGVGYWRISPYERRLLTAVARAAVHTGVPVMVHLEHGSAAWEVLDALNAEGLSSDRVVLAHIDRNLDPGLHADLATAGAYLGYDGVARHREAPDSAIIDCAESVIAAGGLARLLLGGDVARATRYRVYGGLPGLDYLPRRFLPRLEHRIGSKAVRRILITNPANLLTLAQGC
jgi:predicted metal-dependent phosphotriesterase family hydrolase